MEKTKKTYSREFKIKAVELSNERGNATQIAEELGIRVAMLYKWQTAYNKGQFRTGLVQLNDKETEELKRLRKELNEVKLERDILKKAVVIFTKSDQ
jgi:transposase